MINKLYNFIRIADCEVTFSIDEGKLNAHFEKLTSEGRKIFNYCITDTFINQSQHTDIVLGMMLEQWKNSEEYYT